MSSYSYCDLYKVLNNFVNAIKNKNIRIMNTLQYEGYEKGDK